MKQTIIILLLLFVVASLKAQLFPQFGYSLANDTIFVSAVSTDTIIYKKVRAKDGLAIDINYNSFGSTNDSIKIGGSTEENGTWAVMVDNDGNLLSFSVNSGADHYYNSSHVLEKGQQITIDNQKFMYLVLYFKVGSATNDTVIFKYNK